MKERPILFNGDMVRAILEGRKSQTRRVIKFKYTEPVTNMTRHEEPFSDSPKGDLSWSADHYNPKVISVEQNIRCPYGKPGDRLYVRETWTMVDTDGGCESEIPFLRPPHLGIEYRADGHELDFWKPSIHMPRWASRITLEVTEVRAERVQEITQADAESEGVDFLRHHPDADEPLTAKELFICLWDSINKKRGYGWDENPWTWSVSFKRVD